MKREADSSAENKPKRLKNDDDFNSATVSSEVRKQESAGASIGASAQEIALPGPRERSAGMLLSPWGAALHEDSDETTFIADKESGEAVPIGVDLYPRNLMPLVWKRACGSAICAHFFMLTLFGYFPRILPSSVWFHEIRYGSGTGLGSADFKWASAIACACFIASAVRGLTSFLFITPKQRPVIYCLTTVSIVSSHSHYIMARGALPILDTCWGRTMHTAHFVEWVPMVFLLMVVMNALDCEGFFQLQRSVFMVAGSVTFGAASSVCCQLAGGSAAAAGGGGGNCALRHWEHRGAAPGDPYKLFVWRGTSSAYKLACGLMLLSCLTFLDLFRVLRERLHTTAKSTAAKHQRLLLQWMAATWTLFPVVYLLGILNLPWFSSSREELCYVVIDVLSKFMFANVLSEAHLQAMSPEAEMRADLELKHHANRAQRHFLRYVFHEVRVPLNTIKLGVESMKSEAPSEAASGAFGSPTGAGGVGEYSGHSANGNGRTGSLGGSSLGGSSLGGGGGVGGGGGDTEYVLHCVDEAVRGMSGTLNDVLSYQKIEEGILELNLAPFGRSALLQQAVSDVARGVADKGLVLKVEEDESLPYTLHGDCARIQQVPISPTSSKPIQRC